MRKILLFVALLSGFSNVIEANPKSIFIPNMGQWNHPFSHKSQFGNLTVFTTESGFRFLLSEATHYHHADGHEHNKGELVSNHAFSLNLVNSNLLNFQGENRMKGIHNYFSGKNPSDWVSKVPLYGGVKALDVYDGIDLIAYGAEGSFKYDFIVNPGASHEKIELSYSGLDLVRFNTESITLVTSLGELVESIPVCYQVIEGNKVEVRTEYVKTANGFGFLFPQGYNKAYALVIDPVLVAATLSGTTGTNQNFGHGACYDLAGNIYTQGISFDSEYPTDEGSFQAAYGGGVTDAVISKLSPDGSELIYATFLGGSEREYPISTIVNGNEEIYVFGVTDSPNYPVADNAFQPIYNGGGEDIFVTALSADGSEILGSTYIGGTGFDGRNFTGGGATENYRGEIDLNLNGEVYLATCSSSEDFPITSGSFQEDKLALQDGVVLKMNSDLSELIWSTFIGSEGSDMVHSVQIMDDQSLYVCGSVSWDNQVGAGGVGFVTTDGAYQTEFSGIGAHDGFITHFESDGSAIISSTLLGLEGLDKNYFVDFDSEGNIWTLMQTQSAWPVTDGVWGTGSGNLCIHKMNPELTELLATSYLTTGSSGDGSPTAFMVDDCNNIYVSSSNFEGSSDLIATEDAIFDFGGFYIGVYAPEMADLDYGTYYTSNHVDGGTSRFDKQGIIYQGVCSCEDFNVTDNAWAPTSTTVNCDVGVFKIDLETESVFASGGAAGFLTGCAPHTVVFDNFSSAVAFEWDFDDGTTSDEFEPTVTFEEPGEYLVQLVAFDPESCNLTDTAYIPITVLPQVEFFTGFSYSLDCETGLLQITDASQGPADVEYEWDMGDGNVLTDVNPTYQYEEPGTYTITLTLSSEACNEEMTEEQTVVYSPFVDAEFNFQIVDICDSFLVDFINQSSGGVDYTWNMGDGNTLNESGNFGYTYEFPGTYTVELVIENEFSCNLTDTIVQIIEIVEPPTLNPEISISQIGLCEDLAAIASTNIDGAVADYSWFIDGELVGTDEVLNTSVLTPGLYTIQVIVTDAVCQNDWTSEVQFEFYQNLGFELPSDLSLCYNQASVLLDATVDFDEATYSWNGGLSIEPILEVSEEGDFEVSVSFNGCNEIQETNVISVQEFSLAFEALICEGQPSTITFEDEFNIIEQVNWMNGQTGFQFIVDRAGYYPFVALDIFGCDQVDSLLVLARDDDPNLEIPNVFTPNGDGFNDFFQIQGDELVFFDLEIYDRWGKLVHQTTEIYSTWDGNYNTTSGAAAGEDTFMYVLKYRDLCDIETKVETGNIQILR